MTKDELLDKIISWPKEDELWFFQRKKNTIEYYAYVRLGVMLGYFIAKEGRRGIMTPRKHVLVSLESFNNPKTGYKNYINIMDKYVKLWEMSEDRAIELFKEWSKGHNLS